MKEDGKRSQRKIDEFRKKKMIPEPENPHCEKHIVKSKTGKIFANEKILEKYCVKIYEIDPYFYEKYKQIKIDENEDDYTLFRIDVYFSEFDLTVEVDEKERNDREKKRPEAVEKKLDWKFIRINTSKENYDADYEISRILKFISEFKNKRIRRRNKTIKRKNNYKGWCKKIRITPAQNTRVIL